MNYYAMADDTGRILQVAQTSYTYVLASEDVSDTTHYVKSGELYPKQELSFSIERDGFVVTLTGLPAGLTVATNGMDTVTDDTPLVIEYDLPGTYTIRFSGHVRCLDHELEVTVGDT